jgi:DNA sulfur modification protein DndB
MQAIHRPVNEPYYTFPAIRGMQAGKEYYDTICPLRLVPRLFLFDEEELPPAMRAQRTLNKGRIPAIAKYLVENSDDYVFSAITASIDGEVEFIPVDGSGSGHKIGELHIPMNARIIINDGQHRRAAIEKALREKPDLGFDTISVVFFIDAGLKRCQQMFADLNQHAIRPTKSLGILYDHRDEFSRFVIRLVDKVDIFRGRVELERTSISNRSTNLFTLSSVYQATRALLAKLKATDKISKEEEDLAAEFWTTVSENIREWRLLMDGKITPYEIRRDYVHSHGVVLQALGIAGHSLIEQHPTKWQRTLKKLNGIDWSRSNSKLWEGRTTVGGTVTKARTNLVLTTNLFKKLFDIPLTQEELRVETFYTKPNEVKS